MLFAIECQQCMCIMFGFFHHCTANLPLLYPRTAINLSQNTTHHRLKHKEAHSFPIDFPTIREANVSDVVDVEDIVGQYCVALKSRWRFSRNLVGEKKRGQSTTLNVEKISELVQGHLPGINAIRESGSSAGTMCLRERYSPQQLPA